MKNFTLVLVATKRIRIITKRERQIQQLRTRIAELEAITNRTAEQERELQEKKTELAKLEKQQEESSKKPTNYWPWIIGGGIILVLVIGIVAYLLMGKDKPKKNNFK